MRKKPMRKRMLAFGLIAAMIMSSAQIAGATTIQKAENKKSEAQSNLNSVNKKIKDIEAQQATLQAEINKVDADLVDVLVNIETTKKDIENKKIELAQAEADLVVAKETEAQQYSSMKERIRYMYENGDSTFMTALMGSDNFADVLNKVESFSKVYDYDRNLLIEYQNTKIEVENLVAQVEEEKAELEEIEETYEEQQAELERVKAEKSSQLDNYEAKLAEAQRLASQYQATITEQNRIIAEAQAAAAAAAAAARVNSVTRGSSSVASAGSSSGSSSSSGTSGSSSSSGQAQSAPKASGSGTGSSVANYACQFIGNPYVWGGTSLTGGCDCSGFVMSVYAHYGVSLPHSSGAMRGVGRGVSVSEMQPGDIVCYSGHVGIYVGNNTIVNASNSKPYPAGGIKYTSATYKSILAVRRVF